MNAICTPSGADDGVPVKALFIPLTPPPFAKVHDPPVGLYCQLPFPTTGASKPALGMLIEVEPAVLERSLTLSYLTVPGLLFPLWWDHHAIYATILVELNPIAVLQPLALRIIR